MSNVPLHVLLVEDEPADARLILHELRQAGFAPESTCVETEPEFLVGLDRAPEIILCDYNLPQFDALRAIELVKVRQPDIPFLIVSGSIGEETAVEAIKLGVTDYLLKDRLGRLGAAVKQALEQRKLREAERKNAERLARDAVLLASVRDSVIVTDLAGVVTYWNAGAERLFGWTAAETIGRPYADRFPKSTWNGIPVQLREHAMAGEWEGEYEDYRKDGSRVWIHARVSRIANAPHLPAGIMSVSHDITNRKRAEETLRLRDRGIQAVTQGILITDASQPGNPIIYASPAFERLTGYSHGEILGKNCRFLQGQDTDPAAIAQIRSAIRAEQPCKVELLNYRKDGKPFWNELSIAPVRDDGGLLTHFVGVQTDVTESRRLEEQFRQSQKMEAVGRLAGGIAHDFNNLLTVINGYAEMLLADFAADDPKREVLQEIHRSGERAANLTRQLLAFSRRQVLKPVVLDLNLLLDGVEKLLRRLIGAGIDLNFRQSVELWPVESDPGQLEQVVMNLAINARDAMPQGGKLLIRTENIALDESYAAAHSEVAAGDYVLLTVEDTGHGMDQETQSKIFEPFFTTKALGKGTGLGLATVYGIVRQSGGQIAVYSEAGVGTSFKIYLPRSAAKVPLRPPSKPAPAAAGGKETILLVEDEPGVRAITATILESRGYTVLVAEHGKKALQILAQTPQAIDILLTDIVLPDMNGPLLGKQLANIRPEMKILYFSGYSDEAAVQNGLIELNTPFLQKPFKPSELASKVREVLDGNGQ